MYCIVSKQYSTIHCSLIMLAVQSTTSRTVLYIIDVGAQDEAPAPNEGVIEEVIAVAEGEDEGMVVVE